MSKFNPVKTKEIKILFDDLASPLHSESLRDRLQKPVCGKEADLSAGYCIKLTNTKLATQLNVCLKDFDTFMSKCMKVNQNYGEYKINVSIGIAKGCPEESAEAFCVSVGIEECNIIASNADGARRALIWLEDEMTIRRAPFLPVGNVSRWAVIEERISHSPCSSGRWGTGWELEDDVDYYPAEYLNKLVHCGINSIWVAGMLRRLVASKLFPELGPSTHKLAKLKRLVKLAAQYGIRVYLLCIEPRSLPDDHPAFVAHPEIKGAKICEVTSAMCTSTELIQEYIRDIMRTLFTEVPDLAGIINIFNGERGTTCWLQESIARTCPRCSKKEQAEVLAENLSCFMDGIRQASPTAKLLAWTYTMDSSDSMTAGPLDPMLQTIMRSDPRITWLGNFEHGGKKTLCNKTYGVNEYSISYVGPSEAFKKIAKYANKSNSRCYAKLQLGTSYEMSSLPYIPAPGIVYEKFAGMRKHKVGGAMINWIIGGYPSVMLKAAGESSFEPILPKKNFMRRLAGLYWPPNCATEISQVWECFGKTFLSYPNFNTILYFSPITRGPAYHLDIQNEPCVAYPYNWGIDCKRAPQPFENQVSRWIGPFTAENIIKLFRKMGNEWVVGLDRMNECLVENVKKRDILRQTAVASAARLMFLSTANAVEFYSLRNKLDSMKAGKKTSYLLRMKAIVQDDIALAQETKRFLAIDPFIGFQTEMLAYSFSPKLLDEKIRQSRLTLKILEKWIQTGNKPKSVAIKTEQSKSAATKNEKQNSFDLWLEYCCTKQTWQGKIPEKPSYKDWLANGD